MLRIITQATQGGVGKSHRIKHRANDSMCDIDYSDTHNGRVVQ